MNTIRLGRTNVRVPAVSLGTWGHGGPRKSEGASVGWSGNDDGEARKALAAAYRSGITHWDTADVYGDGHAEELIGSVWGEVPRGEICLATKVGWDKSGERHFYHPRVIRERMDRSLRLLRTDDVDLHYFHHCDFGPDDRYFDDALATMLELREEGKFRFLGLSDWDLPKIMRFVERVDPDVIQPYRNLVDDAWESSGLRAWVEANDRGVAFFSPLKHGLLLGKYEKPVEFPEGDFRRGIAEFGDAAALDGYRRAAAALRERFASQPEPVLHGVIGALLADAPTATVLLGQRNPRQVEAAARVGEPLSKEDAAWVKAQFRGGFLP